MGPASLSIVMGISRGFGVRVGLVKAARERFPALAEPGAVADYNRTPMLAVTVRSSARRPQAG